MTDDKKYLIIHMDDMGSSHAANAAGIDLFLNGVVTSCSVMIPCAYAFDFIRWWKHNQQFDTGVHFTLTCEWDNAKWRPVGEYTKTASLWNSDSFMWQSNDEVLQHANMTDVYHELDMQIKLALEWGLTPSHFDRHMHTITSNHELCDIYVDLAKKYNIMYQVVKDEYFLPTDAVIDTKPIDSLIGIGAEPGLNLEQKRECLYEIFKNLEPGITQLTIHPVIDTPEIRNIIPDWHERYDEYLLFMSDKTRKVIEENNIELIDYATLQHLSTK